MSTGASDGRLPRVLYVVYANPAAYPPLEHGAHVLAANGAHVRFLGTVGSDDVRRLSPADGVEQDLVPFQPEGWQQKAHYAGFVWRAARLARAWQPHWVYASDVLSAMPALMAARVARARLVYHEHDAPAVAGGSGFMQLARRARTAVATRAEVRIVPSRGRAEQFTAETGADDVTVVLNTPLRREQVARTHHPEPSCLCLAYHGSIVPARLPAAVLHALQRLPSGVTLRIAGYETVGHRGYIQYLVGLAAELRLGDRVTFAGTAPTRAELLAGTAMGDVGLALMPLDTADFNEQTMAGASNKPFDYLACGLGLLVADRPEWRELFVDAGVARTCDPDAPDSIAEAVNWFLRHSDELARMGERGRRLIDSEWNYEAQFASVANRMLSVPEERRMSA